MVRILQIEVCSRFYKSVDWFLKPVAERMKPVLFQHLTDSVFRKCLNDHFQVLYATWSGSTIGRPSRIKKAENGALHYVAGYTCRQLWKKLERESHEFKEEMVLCLMRMVKDKDPENDMQGVDEQWTALIDRGGLWHATETTYQFFVLLCM